MKKNQIVAIIMLVVVAAGCFISGKAFMATWEEDVIIPGPGVTEVRMLSEYFPGLEGTAGDTEIYVMEGEEEGGSVLILGGTHANEMSAT